jgi:hypothetical protein
VSSGLAADVEFRASCISVSGPRSGQDVTAQRIRSKSFKIEKAGQANWQALDLPGLLVVVVVPETVGGWIDRAGWCRPGRHYYREGGPWLR